MSVEVRQTPYILKLIEVCLVQEYTCVIQICWHFSSSNKNSGTIQRVSERERHTSSTYHVAQRNCDGCSGEQCRGNARKRCWRGVLSSSPAAPHSAQPHTKFLGSSFSIFLVINFTPSEKQQRKQKKYCVQIIL